MATLEQFLASLRGCKMTDWERAVLAEKAVIEWTPLHVGSSTLSVSADYYSIELEDIVLRVPMGAYAAQIVCDLHDAALPTRFLVDAIYHQADVKLAAQPWGPPYDSSMYSPERMTQQDFKTDIALMRCDHAPKPGSLLAGHRKDVILSARMKPDRLSFYGWFSQGKPIQQVPAWPTAINWPHEASYFDYSHGIRLVSRKMLHGCTVVDYCEALRDPELCKDLSDEGPLKVTRYERP